jgi:formylglycine-generating enzyme required for sulfatase activity
MYRAVFTLLALAFFSVSFTSKPGPKKIKMPKAFVYVPSGTLLQGQEKVAIQGFYMASREITNLDYREFLYQLKAEGNTDAYEKARVRPEGWNQEAQFNEPLKEHYHSHPAYEEYPVVNITQEGARLYCAWLTKILQAQHPDYTIVVRLPTEKEWMYAARGGKEDVPYPNGYFLRDADGHYLYKFRRIGDELLHLDPATGKVEVMKMNPVDNTDFTPGPAKSGLANDFGLYNMSGNVAEMLQEDGRTKGGSFRSTGYDIRIDAPDTYAGFKEASPLIGFRPVVTFLGK